AQGAKTLRMRVGIDPVNFDWNNAGSYLTRFIFTSCMEGLVGLDAKLNPVPQLAKKATVSSDGRTYLFELREGVKWSDGQPLTAADFVTSWKRLLDPLDRKDMSVMLANVVNADAYRLGTLKDFSLVGIKALAPDRLEVKLAQAQADFMKVVTLPMLYPMRADLLERFGQRAWHEPGKIVTLGPFLPAVHEKHKSVLLKRNPLYYGPPPKIDAVSIEVLDEDAKAVERFKKGEFDFVIPLNFKEAAAAKAAPGFHVSPQLRTRTLFLNTAKYPLTLVKVRQAISLAIDRKAFASYLQGIYATSSNWLPPQLAGPATAEPARFDLAKARSLLAESGFAPSASGKLELGVLSTDENAYVSSFIVDQLKRNLDLNVDVKLLSRDAMIQQVELRAHPMFIYSRPADYPDAYAFLAALQSASNQNTPGWKSAEFDGLLKSLELQPSGPGRDKLVGAALELVLDKEAPVVPLFVEAFSYLVSPRVHGLEVSPMADINLATATIE
ncbi:MAG: peptide ABC transporter substrate-binding protein, partial [Deltaproteobacteria bacterium]|nr:peptide ABC transporter substrate-binding protein [Deltaproteobacteria bacterium]